DFGTDGSWRFSRKKEKNWQNPEFADKQWQPAHELGSPEMAPWKLEKKLVSSLSMALEHGEVRASLVASDPLMTALGRPSREQVLTSRMSAATTLQGLELTNGDTLAKVVEKGAQRL